ncbi:MAG: radical SAM protein, partial [Desulfovibrio sp.]|nr:radical SAM protein [Desulfovibrio sp.]
RRLPVLPCFLPFHGCRSRCLFCAQNIITGVHTEVSIEQKLAHLWRILKDQRKACELAFFGGTFTALPDFEFEQCLVFAAKARDAGLIQCLRCSTRPDTLDEERLKSMRKNGFHLIELGIQSFSDRALEMSQRGYSGIIAQQACQKVKGSGFELGVQLLPGLPGGTAENFLHDVACAIKLGCCCLRFYPCLVLSETKLAEQWRAGMYQPWTLEETIAVLAKGLRMAQEAGVQVIRMGLPFDEHLLAGYLAGPIHPALGSRVQARALFDLVAQFVQRNQAVLEEVYMPKHVLGFFYGHKREMEESWSELGITGKNLFFEGEEAIKMQWHVRKK